MADRLREIYKRILEWWNRFTSRQKTIIIGIAAMVVFTFAILIFVFSRPHYTRLITAEDTSAASQITKILDDASITYRASDDGLRIDVLSSQLSEANLALGSAGFAPADYSIDDALSGGFSTTESDKQKRTTVYLERKLARDFESYTAVKSASVHLNIPNQDGTLVSKREDSSAYIRLELDGAFTAENAANMARAAATALGNTTTANITIVDTDANLLFSGEEDYTSTGIASSMLELRQQAEDMVSAQVKRVLLGTDQFDTVEVASRLDINFANYEKTVSEYYAPTGREEGMITHRELYESENQGSNGGVPGTDSNDETTYQYQDQSSSSSSSSESSTDYKPNESIEKTITPAGGIDYTNSSISITATAYKEVREELAKAQGLLDGITWEQYKADNSAPVRLETDADLISLVANATGISSDKISLVAYEQPIFYDTEGFSADPADILSILMLIIILALLLFVVLRGMRSRKGEEEKQVEELSVENLLQSAPGEAATPDIEVESKSETRKLIEKFVDDNPEAAANLLRNWLTEDW